MKTKESYFYIVDRTNNHNAPYIDAINYKNSGDTDGCLRFKNIHDANDFIHVKGWQDWASTEELF